MSCDDERKPDPARRQVLRCMTWAGTAMIWTVAGGIPRARLVDRAEAAVPAKGFSFAQISDSHQGFDKPVNPDPTATLRPALDQVTAGPDRPAFLIHTGWPTRIGAGARPTAPRRSAT